MVRTGLDRLLAEEIHLVRGARVGLLCNPTAVTARLVHAVDALQAHPDVRLVRLFGPEHGVWGEAQDMIGIGGETDPVSGLPLVSLYGHEEASLRPPAGSFDGLDALIYDIQDVGSRYYTYACTLGYCMEACAEADVRVIVLDRPNPIGGLAVEGGAVRRGFESFVGQWSVANRHGLTVGELARLLHLEHGVGAEPEVVGLDGWRRGQMHGDTGVPWVMPSPNMPTVDTALVYPGGCLVEGTNLSEARGTTRPFELVGAPFLDGRLLAKQLSALDLPGVAFRGTRFEPTFQKHAGRSCGGVQLHVTDARAFKPLLTGVAILREALAQAPDDFAWRADAYEFRTDRPAIDLLAGNDVLRPQIEAGEGLAGIEASWEEERLAFLERRAECLLYAEGD
jgi:uncharacterized protein YbbC (DUF1343 family)